ncbi:MAG: CxxxxCH/CxxCH domain-containing protein, partial [Desulfobulbus sp.]
MRTNISSLWKIFLFTAAALTMAGGLQAQLEAPHDVTSATGCLSCHNMQSTYPNLVDPPPGFVQQDRDDTASNNVCWGCHNDIEAPYRSTHSSLQTDESYGQWSVPCGACHNPHLQEQKVNGNVAYGKFIKRKVNLADITYEDATPPKSGVKDVVFVGPTGLNSFADGDPAKIDGICEVCHTKTGHWTNDGSKANLGVHTGLGGTNCMSCHPHGEGFKADCGACHGFPPEDGATLVSNPGPTGSATAGAHLEHTANQAIGCDSCHYKNIPDGEHNNGAPLSVTIGFGPNAPIPQGGSYDGQATVPYDRTVTVPETTVSSGGSKTCATLYCHGNYAGSGLNASPVWDNPATGDCGTCHGASNNLNSAPASGSHERHADVDPAGGNPANRGYKCTLCHFGLVEGTGPTYTLPADKSKHVNGLVEWTFDGTDSRVAGASYGTATGTEPPTDGVNPNRFYSTCSNVYCHSIVQTATGGALTPNTVDYKTPAWGTTFGCGACHNTDGGHSVGTAMNSGSHTGHLAYAFTTTWNSKKCDVCHAYGTVALTVNECASCHQNGERTDHSDGEVDIMFKTDFTGVTAAYNGTPAPGDGYSTCSSTYCHGNYAPSGLNATPTWGTAASASCGTCHGASNTTPPTDSAATSSTSHRWHAATGDTATQSASGYNLNCGTCHNSVVNGSGPASYTIASKTLHVNKAVDWQFDTTDTRVSAGSAYSVATATQPPSDGVTRAYGTCSMIYCHSNGQTDGGGAPDYKTPQWGANYTCGDAVTGCHPVDPAHNATGPRMSTGSHTAHLAYTFNLSSNRRQCTTCHKWNQSAPFNSGCSACHGTVPAHTARNTYHVNKEVNLLFETNFTGAAAAYNGTSTPGDGYANCSATYCHGDGTSVATGAINANTTPDWGSAALACNACHGYGPSYANGTPKANNHVEHIGAGITCDKCHYDTTNDGTTIASKTLHVNRAYNVTPNTGAGVTFTYTYAATGGSCSSVSCHGGTWTATWGHTHDVSYNAAVDLSQVSMPGDNPCADCHSGNNADGDGTPLNSWSDILSEHVTGCVRCHEYTDDGSGTPPQAANDNAIATGVGVTCTTCHTPKLDPAPASDHGGHDATHFGWSGGCQNCHGDGTATEAVVSIIHANACDLCHTTGGPYNKTTEKIGANGDGDATLANGAADAATPFDPTLYTCTTCHNQAQVPGFHGITIAEVYSSHQLSSDSSGGYDCEACHSANVANEQLSTHMPADLVANCAIICHANTTPSATSGIVAKTVIDAVTWASDPNPNNSRCENCHAAKGDYRLHGLTDDASVADGIGEGATHGVAFHDNLGNS